MSSMPPYPSGPQPPGPYGPYGAGPYGNVPYGGPSYGGPAYGPGGYPEAYPQAGYGGGFGPPPPKSKAPLVLGVIAAVLVLVVLGGVGGFLLLKDDQDSSDRASSEETASSESDEDVGSSQDQEPATEDDGSLGQPVRPEGAPYSYRIPAGFVRSAEASDTAGSYETEIVPSGGNGQDAGIVVSVAEELGTTDLDQLEDNLTRLQAEQGVTVISSSRTRIDGEEALRLDVTEESFSGTFNYAITTGGQVLGAACIWSGEANRGVVERGCQELLASMTVD